MLREIQRVRTSLHTNHLREILRLASGQTWKGALICCCAVQTKLAMSGQAAEAFFSLSQAIYAAGDFR